ncbi:hypothetical protein ACFL6Y_06875 [Elusimicrobiota bacterium]
MKKIIEKIVNLDRRIIFLSVILVILFPIIHPLKLPGLKVTAPVRGVYDQIEALPPGSTIAVSFDFDPASKPELYPMGMAVCRHAFSRNIKIVGMNLWVTGTGLADEIITTAANEYNKKYGEDYVFLGWQPLPIAVITGVFTNVYKIYPKDQKGNTTKGLPVLEGFNSFQDADYFVSLGAGYPGLIEWVQFGTDKFKVKIGAGCTAVSEPGLRPFYPIQITGLIPAMKGAAEYEALIGKPDMAVAGLDAISLAHFLIIFFIILCNITPFLLKLCEEKK